MTKFRKLLRNRDAPPAKAVEVPYAETAEHDSPEEAIEAAKRLKDSGK